MNEQIDNAFEILELIKATDPAEPDALERLTTKIADSITTGPEAVRLAFIMADAAASEIRGMTEENNPEGNFHISVLAFSRTEDGDEFGNPESLSEAAAHLVAHLANDEIRPAIHHLLDFANENDGGEVFSGLISALCSLYRNATDHKPQIFGVMDENGIREFEVNRDDS